MVRGALSAVVSTDGAGSGCAVVGVLLVIGGGGGASVVITGTITKHQSARYRTIANVGMGEVTHHWL